MTEPKTRGRKPRIRTIEDIDEKLTEAAKPFLWVNNQEAYEDLVIHRRMMLLSEYYKKNAPAAADQLGIVLFSGHKSPLFNALPDNIKAEYDHIETEFKKKYIDNSILRREFNDITQKELQAIYKQIVLINCFYEWMMTPPQNGGTNYYTVIAEWCGSAAIYREFVLRDIADMFQGFITRDPLPAVRTQKQAFEALNDNFLFIITPVVADTLGDCYRHGGGNDPEMLEITKDLDKCALEIIKRFNAITLKQLRTKEKPTPVKYNTAPALESSCPLTLNGIHSPFMEEFAKLTEKDVVEMPYASDTSNKHYETDRSDLILNILNSKAPHSKEAKHSKDIKKDILTDKILRTAIQVGIDKGGTFKQDGIFTASRSQFMQLFGYAAEQIKDKTIKRNFFLSIREQLFLLSGTSFATKSACGIDGSNIHIIDAFKLEGDTVYIRIGKEFLNGLLKYKKIGWNTITLQANKIPNKRRIEYRLQIKLEQDFSSSHTMAQQRDTIKMNSLLKYLEGCGLIGTHTTRYKEYIADRIIEALKYLQNVNKSIEFYFLGEDGSTPLNEEQLQSYLTRANFPKLKLWYTIPLLEQSREEQTPKAIENAVKKKERKEKRQKAQEAATDRRLGELMANKLFEKTKQDNENINLE